MCFLCDNPEATPADYDRYLDDLIARFGWAIQAVAPDRARAPLAYTIGLTRFDVPELVEADLNPVVATAQGVDLVDVKLRLGHGEPVDAGVPRRLRDAD